MQPSYTNWTTLERPRYCTVTDTIRKRPGASLSIASAEGVVLVYTIREILELPLKHPSKPHQSSPIRSNTQKSAGEVDAIPTVDG